MVCVCFFFSGGGGGGRSFSQGASGKDIKIFGEKTTVGTLPTTHIAPANRPSQKETNIPTIHSQLRTVSFILVQQSWKSKMLAGNKANKNFHLHNCWDGRICFGCNLLQLFRGPLMAPYEVIVIS